jgi:hypothetical protein
MHSGFGWGSLKEGEHFYNVFIEGKVSKLITKQRLINFLRIETCGGCCEHCTEASVFKKMWRIF